MSYLSDSYGTWRGWVRHQLAVVEFFIGRVDGWVTLRHPAKVRRLVFVCLGNINRSVFAEFVARSQGLKTCSLGLATSLGSTAFPKAIATAKPMGFDLESHRSTPFDNYAAAEGDLLLVMEIRHAHALIRKGVPTDRIALLGAWSRPVRFHLHDPHTLSDDYFRSCFALIQSAVLNLADELRAAQSPCANP